MTIRILNPRYARALANAILPEEPVHDGSWVNMWFFKDGSSLSGMLTYGTQQEAFQTAEDVFNEAKAKFRPDFRLFIYNHPHLFWNDISHHMQMPARGDKP